MSMSKKKTLLALTELDCIKESERGLCKRGEEGCPFFKLVMEGNDDPFQCTAPRFNEKQINYMVKKISDDQKVKWTRKNRE